MCDAPPAGARGGRSFTPTMSHDHRTPKSRQWEAQQQTHTKEKPHTEPQTPSERESSKPIGERAIPGSGSQTTNNQTIQPHIVPQTPPERETSQPEGRELQGSTSLNSDIQASPKENGQLQTSAKKRQASPLKTTTGNPAANTHQGQTAHGTTNPLRARIKQADKGKNNTKKR